jgi:hypothetical protein
MAISGKEHAMPGEPNSAKDIFLAAIDKATAAARAAFLDEACAGDADLRQRVEALLRAHDGPENILDRPPIGHAATVAEGAAPPANAERSAEEVGRTSNSLSPISKP